MAEPILVTEADEDALNAALSGISDTESSYDPLAGQRSVFETDDPEILQADEDFYKFMSEATDF